MTPQHSIKITKNDSFFWSVLINSLAFLYLFGLSQIFVISAKTVGDKVFAWLFALLFLFIVIKVIADYIFRNRDEVVLDESGIHIKTTRLNAEFNWTDIGKTFQVFVFPKRGKIYIGNNISLQKGRKTFERIYLVFELKNKVSLDFPNSKKMPFIGGADHFSKYTGFDFENAIFIDATFTNHAQLKTFLQGHGLVLEKHKPLGILPAGVSYDDFVADFDEEIKNSGM